MKFRSNNNEPKFNIMLKHLFLSASVMALLASCEPVEIIIDDYDRNPLDTTFSSGSTLVFKSNGTTSVYQSIGMGSSCYDTATSLTSWALFTGNNITFDPAAQAWGSGPNDTVFALIWQSVNGGVGSYTIPGPTNAQCFMQTPTSFRWYDASLLNVSVTKMTTDSIYGFYSGPLLEVTMQIDPMGNLSYLPTGLVDTVSATFGVYKPSCF